MTLKTWIRKKSQYDFLFYIPTKDRILWKFYLLKNIVNVKYIILIDSKKSFKPTVMKLYLGQWVRPSYIEVVE